MGKLIRTIFLLVLFSSCDDPIYNLLKSQGGVLGGVRCGGTKTTRIGAKCNDGTITGGTATGTCGSNGGVGYWICNN